MRRWIAKFYIGHALDAGKSVPAWVQRLVQRDPELAIYQRDLHGLANKLRQDADSWAGASFDVDIDEPLVSVLMTKGDASSVERSSAWRSWSALTLVTAAVLLLAFTWWSFRDRTAELPSDLQQTAQASPVGNGQVGNGQVGNGQGVHALQTSSELRALLATASAGEQVVRKVALGVGSLAGKLVELPGYLALDAGLESVEKAGTRLQVTGNDTLSALQKMARLVTKSSGTAVEPATANEPSLNN